MKRKNNTAKILILVSIFSITISAFILLSGRVNMAGFSAAFLSTNEPVKIKVLLVAGHEPNAGGADEFKKIKERNLNLELAVYLKNELSKNPNIEVIMVRDEQGWNTELSSYVKTNQTQIMSWVSEMKDKMLVDIEAGKIKLIDPNMKHNDAATNAVLFLYGTNKWIEEKNIDLVLHIHFNNNPKYKGKPNYRGYCMYVPDRQYLNYSSSKIFADYLNEEISKIEKTSNMPQEKDIIIEDQQLIATGNYNTLKIPSVLVEYAYIYEPMMISSSSRNIFIKTAASSTAVAIEKYISEVMKK